jgi:hypothetical protein
MFVVFDYITKCKKKDDAWPSAGLCYLKAEAKVFTARRIRDSSGYRPVIKAMQAYKRKA